MVQDRKEIMVVCPYVKCNKVMFRGGEVELNTDKANILSYPSICPHCGQKVKIKVGIAIKADPVY